MIRPAPAPIGVILKTWNTGEVTCRCLDAIVSARLWPEEIAIVDLGSDSAAQYYASQLTDEHGIRLRWLSEGRRLAPSIANRLALEAISTPLVCLLDNDVIVPRNWLAPLLSMLASPGVGLVAPIRPDPFLAYPGRSESTESVVDDCKARRLPLADVVGVYTGGLTLDEFGRRVRRANDLPPRATLEFPSFLSSCCLCFDRAAVEDAGGIADSAFDRGYGSEDVDLSWRVLEAGYELVRTAEVFVLHLRHVSIEANGVDVAAELAAANVVLYDRWRQKLLAWAIERHNAGDPVSDQSRRFIIRELLRNTRFAGDLQTVLSQGSRH